MKNYKKILAAICAAGCLVVLTACGNKTEKLLEFVDNADFSGALDYYDDEIDGSSKERDLRKEIQKGMEDRYEDILEKFNKNEIDDEDMEDFFELIDTLKIDDDDDDYEEFMASYRDMVIAKQNYQLGLDNLDEGFYSDAIYYFELITEEDGNYEDAQAKIEEAENAIIDEKLAQVQDYIDSEDYSYAIDLLDDYEDELSGNDEYNRMLADAEAGIISNVKEVVDGYFAEYEYYDAYYYLDDMVYYYPDIDEIQTMYDELEDNYVAYVLADASAYFDNKDYETAVNIIEYAIDEIGDDNTELANTYSEYKSYLPTYLNTLEYLACDGSVYTADKDNTNTTHKYSFYMDGWGENVYWAEYLINGNYNTFSGVCGLSYYERSTTDTKYFEIYGDGKLLYTSPTMTASSLPQEFSIDITGVKILKISYPATPGSNSIATLYDGLLTRSEDGAAEVTQAATEAATAAATEAATEAAAAPESSAAESVAE